MRYSGCVMFDSSFITLYLTMVSRAVQNDFPNAAKIIIALFTFLSEFSFMAAIVQISFSVYLNLLIFSNACHLSLFGIFIGTNMVMEDFYVV